MLHLTLNILINNDFKFKLDGYSKSRHEVFLKVGVCQTG